MKFYSKPYGRQWKWRYQTHGHIMEPTLKIPKNLQNVKIIDPLNPEKISDSEKPKWQPPRRHPLLENFFPQPTLKDHINYNETPIKLFDKTCKFHAGINQASLLTKTVPFKGLPEAIDKNTNYQLRLNNDEIVSNSIKQALAYTPTKKVCPRLVIPSDVKFKIAREYATPQNEQMKILLESMVRLCTINVNQKNPKSIINRRLTRDTPISTILNRGTDQIQIKRNSELCLFSKSPLSPLANIEQITNTVNYQFIDMFPIFPTIDLRDEHVYDATENTVGWRHGVANAPALHTFFHVNDDQLSDEDNVSKLMVFAFGAAVAQAKTMMLNGALELDEHSVLKKPVVINGVSISDSHRLSYVSYQLNTLDLASSKGVKNICFYDAENELYANRPTVEKLPYPTHKNIQRMAMRELKYNPSAFKKLQSIVGYAAN